MHLCINIPSQARGLETALDWTAVFPIIGLISQQSLGVLTSILRSILSRAEIQFQIHREGWRIQIARGAEGPESYLDSPAFEMDLKLF